MDAQAQKTAEHRSEDREKSEEAPGVANHLAKATRLNELAKDKGWRDALGEAYPEIVRYLERKPVFVDALPIEGADVLEIGPGFGQFTSIIAARARSVKALEVDAQQAAFIVERLRQDKVNNVEVEAGGADCRLPYTSESFDLVILNLVFEWCAIRLAADHREGQQRMLDEIWRVLKPGGRLYLATKNRFAMRYLIGKPDEHFSGMRFGSALPRWLANRLFGHRPPGQLYSWRGLKRMLENTGFSIERSWWAVPDVRECDELVPLENIRQSRRRVQQGSSRSERLLISLLPAPIVKHFSPGLTFLAGKSSGLEN